MREQLRANLLGAHQNFFERIEVDPETGVVTGPYLKFPAYPYIGSRYGEMPKVMIVGMDIGRDPAPGAVQSFEGRRSWIEDAKLDALNAHMSGTCATAMHLLKDQHTEWQRWLDESCDDLVPQKLLNNRQPCPNPLSYIAFTNYYKFMLMWNGQRVQLCRQAEEDFLVTEAKILNPEIIVMQSAGFRHSYHKNLLDRLSEIAKVHTSDHPSVRGERRRLGNLLKSIQPPRS